MKYYNEKDLREAFEAGREYHSPGYRIPIQRWKSFSSWKNRMETHTEYGRILERKASG